MATDAIEAETVPMTAPTTAEGFLADRQVFWSSVVRFVTRSIVALILLLVFLWWWLV